MNRTTNGDSDHLKLNSNFSNGRSNINRFVDVILKIQSKKYVKRTSNGTWKSKKNREKEVFMREMMNKFSSNLIIRYHFLRTVCFKILPRAN